MPSERDRMTNEQLVELIQAGKDEAENMEKLWKQNRGIISKIARKYICRTSEIEDLEQQGYLGLYEAAKRYDAGRGVAFITYACYWINQSMYRYIDNNCNIIRMPVEVNELRNKYKNAISEYYMQYGHEPTEDILCMRLGINRKKLRGIRESVNMDLIKSLEDPVGDENCILSDFIPADTEFERTLINNIMFEDLCTMINNMPEKLKTYMQMVYINDKANKDVSKEIGVCYQNAARTGHDALRAFRTPHMLRR